MTLIASVWGNQKNSAWSAERAKPSRSASAAVRVHGRSSACSAKAGTHRTVILVMIPSAPIPRRAASNTSGSDSREQVRTEPSAVTSWRPTTVAGRPGAAHPVPWVPVDTAPARDCSAKSPRFGCARPSSHSSGPSRCSRVPAQTVTSAPSTRPSAPRVGTIDSTPARSSRDTSTPSVAAAGVKEWPAPTHLTLVPRSAARVTTSLTSATVVGSDRPEGEARTLPAQFCQGATEVVMAGEGTRARRGGRRSWTIDPEWGRTPGTPGERVR